MPFHPITVRGVPLAAGRLPAVCAPLVARTPEALRAEAAMVVARQPDLLEWRIDHFAAIADTMEVLAAARELRRQAGSIPILLTRRSRREGGEAITLSEDEVFDLYEAVARAGCADLLDVEIASEMEDITRAHRLAGELDLGLVLSFHDFQRTPPQAQLLEKFREAHRLGASVAKIALMPQRMEDVHAVLGATLAASRELPIPVVSMAMGPMGAVTRLCGGVFGSALTFAVGAASSAPGQMPINDVRAGLAVLQRAAGATSG